jgi:hypothetical protein
MLRTCSLSTLAVTHILLIALIIFPFGCDANVVVAKSNVSMLFPPVIERQSTRVGNSNIIIMLRTIAAQLPPFATASPAGLLAAATAPRIIAGFSCLL